MRNSNTRPLGEIPFKIRNNLERQGYDIFYFDMGNDGWSYGIGLSFKIKNVQ